MKPNKSLTSADLKMWSHLKSQKISKVSSPVRLPISIENDNYFGLRKKNEKVCVNHTLLRRHLAAL